MSSIQDGQRALTYMVIFQISCFVIGLVLGFWYGMGWFMLFHTLRVLVTSVPRVYVAAVKLLFGPAVANEVGMNLAASRRTQPMTRFSALINVLNLGITVLVFWKINIPFRDIVGMIFARK